MPLIENIDYTVCRIRFPNKGNAAAVMDNSDGTYTIFLNTLFDESAQNDALRHELRHLEAHDFTNTLPIAEVEARAGSVLLPEADGCLIPFFPSETALADWLAAQEISILLQI